MIILTFYILFICNIYAKRIEIQTTLGLVKGKLVNDVTTGARYYSFEGIPYAEPPVGILRFKPPVIKRAWPKVFDATRPGCVCPQIEKYHSRQEMNEDCLNFNIYTPANSLNKLLPVIFTIHSGDFNFLSGNAEPLYGPQFLILHDVVVVTINYRLGALGFLSLCTEEVSGNAGIKDVLLALKIIKKNIIRFGGDPSKITLLGKGAGSVIVQFLMLSNQSSDLFQNVIPHSGSVLSPKYIQFHPRKHALLLGQELGLDMSHDDCMLEELRNVNAFDIVEAQEAIGRRDPQRGFHNFRVFKPTVEVECESAIITRTPLEMLKEGAIQDKSIFLGFNDQEGLEMFVLLRREPELLDRLNENFELCVPSDIKYPYGSVARRNLAARIRNFYFDGGNISFVNVQNYIDLISDTQYSYSVDTFVKLFKEKKKAPVYYNYFTADTPMNWFKAYHNITYPGAAHLDDLGYIYLTTATKPMYPYIDAVAKTILDSTLLSVKNFVYNGKPTTEWPDAGKNGYHIIFDYEPVTVFHRPLPERIGFWSSVYKEYFNSKWFIASDFCTNDDFHSVH